MLLQCSKTAVLYCNVFVCDWLHGSTIVPRSETLHFVIWDLHSTKIYIKIWSTAWCSEMGSLTSPDPLHIICICWRQRTNFTAPGFTFPLLMKSIIIMITLHEKMRPLSCDLKFYTTVGSWRTTCRRTVTEFHLKKKNDPKLEKWVKNGFTTSKQRLLRGRLLQQHFWLRNNSTSTGRNTSAASTARRPCATSISSTVYALQA